MLEAIVFDLDGTLVDTGATVPAAYAATVAALGGPAVPAAAVVAAYPLGATKSILEHFLSRSVSADEVEGYHERLAAIGTIEPYPGVVAALEALHGRVPLAVYTGAGGRAARIVLERAGLTAFFQTVVGGDEVARPKPNPEGLLLAARRLGVPVDATAYVGDAARDLEAAQACGALPVAAAWGQEFTGDARVAHVLHDPAGLAGLLRETRGTGRALSVK